MKRNLKTCGPRAAILLSLLLLVFGVLLPIAPIFADSLSTSEQKAVNEYPNWVADACSGVGVSAGGGVPSDYPPDDQLPGNDNRQKIWNYLISLGFTPVQAAGIEGNIGREGVYDPESIENGDEKTDPDTGKLVGRTKNFDVFKQLTTPQQDGYGLIGFTPGYSLYKGGTGGGGDWPGVSKVKVTRDNFYYISTQLSVVYGYMKNIDDKYGKNMLQDYQNKATSPSAAATAFEDLVENAGVVADSQRDQFANDAMRDFEGTAAPSAPIATGSSGGSTGSGGGCSCSSASPDTTGDAGSVSSSLTGKTAAEQAFNYFISQGLSAQAAAGIVGNMMTESAGNTEKLNTHAHNDISGTHDGIVQWSTSRWAALKSHENGDPYDLATQLDYVWWELTKGDYKSVLADLKGATSAQKAATIFNNGPPGTGYEVSGDTSGDREANAQKIFNNYGGNTPGSPPTSPGGGCDTSAAPTGDCQVTAPVSGSVHGEGEEYTQQQLTQIFGNPGTSADNHPQMDQNLTEVDFNGNQVQVNKLAAPCLEAVAQQIKSENISYKITEMGCYRFDSDNGSSNIGLKSYHTYGVACDINWDANPFSGDGSELPHDMPQAYIQAFHDHGFTWGGDWVSVKDFMHFEFNGIKPQ